MAGSWLQSWLPRSLQPRAFESYTLLNNSSTVDLDPHPEDGVEMGLEKGLMAPRRGSTRVFRLILAALWALSLIIVYVVVARSLKPDSVTRWLPCLSCFPVPASNLTSDPMARGRLELEALYTRQSKSLQQAISRYSMKNGREPPPGYEKFFEWASETVSRDGMDRQRCLVDDYEPLWKDMEPFHQLAERNRTYFKSILEKAKQVTTNNEVAIGTYNIHDGQYDLLSPDTSETVYLNDWRELLDRILPHLPSEPSFEVLFSGRDEPRIVFDTNEIGAMDKALAAKDEHLFGHSPDPLDSWFGVDDDGRGGKRCMLRNRKHGEGFSDFINKDNAFMLFPPSKQFTLDLVPVLSETNIDPCFADIRVPSMFYYDSTGWSPKYSYPNDIAWEDKIEELYWRGATSGGIITEDNYHHFPRFRLVKLAQQSTPASPTNSTLIPNSQFLNVKLTSFASSNCRERCDEGKISQEYTIESVSESREDGYKYKYAFDIDGNGFSGRFLGLMRSGSLVFKSTIFEEYWSAFLKPYKHYIPVLPDLSDLVDKVKWATENDFEAQSIQEAGRMVAETVLNDDQNDCWYMMALLEYARLYNLE